MPVANFDLATAKRVLEATRRVERMPVDKRLDRIHRQPPENSFWVYLTSAGGLNGLHWSWIRVQPAANLPTADDPLTVQDVPLFEMASPVVVGFQNAREVNNSRAIEPGTVVKLEWIGYDRAGEPAFLFTHQPQQPDQVVPPHDHRDNQPQNGGFAFAVYAPGTALPQQAWHL